MSRAPLLVVVVVAVAESRRAFHLASDMGCACLSLYLSVCVCVCTKWNDDGLLRMPMNINRWQFSCNCLLLLAHIVAQIVVRIVVVVVVVVAIEQQLTSDLLPWLRVHFNGHLPVACC